MNWLTWFLALAFSGFVVGGLARLIVPGKDTLGVFGTILAGLAGSFIGGLIAYYLLGSDSLLLNFILAVAAAVLFVIPFRIFLVNPTVVAEQPVVVERPVRRGFWGSRAVGADYGYDRQPFWRRRRSFF
ncbi:MAG TPA: hypothetical protein VHL54_08505 [Actinomycetota bacterium]|jgi:uncharacterized membrane protein YeaQ/YmgE (transglycosylase-associated protein family)|nr:hypothetical protein [Actinomycetota bacterium]